MATSCLMVLNPRRIPECMDAIKALDINTCFLSAMAEVQVYEHFNAIVRHTSYDRFVLISDDCVPTQEGLNKVLEIHDSGHPVVTGYSNLDAVLPFVNLSRKRLHEPPPDIESYDLLTQDEVDAYGEELIPTRFTGFSYTCMSREMWLAHPVEASVNGGQADYVLSWKLQCAGVPIVSHRSTFLHHVKEMWNRADTRQDKRTYVGTYPPEIYWKEVK